MSVFTDGTIKWLQVHLKADKWHLSFLQMCSVAGHSALRPSVVDQSISILYIYMFFIILLDCNNADIHSVFHIFLSVILLVSVSVILQVWAPEAKNLPSFPVIHHQTNTSHGSLLPIHRGHYRSMCYLSCTAEPTSHRSSTTIDIFHLLLDILFLPNEK